MFFMCELKRTRACGEQVSRDVIAKFGSGTQIPSKRTLHKSYQSPTTYLSTSTSSRAWRINFRLNTQNTGEFPYSHSSQRTACTNISGRHSGLGRLKLRSMYPFFPPSNLRRLQTLARGSFELRRFMVHNPHPLLHIIFLGPNFVDRSRCPLTVTTTFDPPWSYRKMLPQATLLLILTKYPIRRLGIRTYDDRMLRNTFPTYYRDVYEHISLCLPDCRCGIIPFTVEDSLARQERCILPDHLERFTVSKLRVDGLFVYPSVS